MPDCTEKPAVPGLSSQAPEEAREFACVANQLLVIPRPKPAESSSTRQGHVLAIANETPGTLYVTNGSDNLIRKISPAGVVSTFNALPAPR